MRQAIDDLIKLAEETNAGCATVTGVRPDGWIVRLEIRKEGYKPTEDEG